MGVEKGKAYEQTIHSRVKGTCGEGREGQRDQGNGYSSIPGDTVSRRPSWSFPLTVQIVLLAAVIVPLHRPVVAAMCVLRLWDLDSLVDRSLDLLRKWRKNLAGRRGLETGYPDRILRDWGGLEGSRSDRRKDGSGGGLGGRGTEGHAYSWRAESGGHDVGTGWVEGGV